MTLRYVLLILGALAVAACGEASVSVGPEAKQNYAPPAGTRHSYAPYAMHSRIHRTFSGVIHVGGDVAPRERLERVITTDDQVDFYMGASRDGVGVARLRNYQADLLRREPGNLLRSFWAAPLLYVDPDFAKEENRGVFLALIDSVYLLNDALPPEFQIIVAGAKEREFAFVGEIVVSLESRTSIAANCGDTAVACATSGVNRAFVRIPDDMDTSEFVYPRSVIVHELLHALGIGGHVDSIEFPDSIMGTAGEYIPNGTHIISKIDREMLQIMYMSRLTSVYNDWGEWTDTSFHLMGEIDDGEVQFGVALFNGLPQPWARGDDPDSLLKDNSRLSGTATWAGSLVGFSGPSPIAGRAELQVYLNTLSVDGSEHDLRFRDIFYVSRFENKDLSDGSDRWFSARDIDYKVEILGNLFSNVQGDEYEGGRVVGGFLGDEHEHVAGTVRRTDMVGAFGGSRNRE